MPRAEAIVQEQVEKFQKWQSGVEASAVVGALRARLASEREAFLRERLAAWPHFRAEDRTRMAALMDDLLNRVLLEPAESLKGERDLRRKLQNLEALRDLFQLDRDDSDPGGQVLKPLRIGTRASALARWQAESVQRATGGAGLRGGAGAHPHLGRSGPPDSAAAAGRQGRLHERDRDGAAGKSRGPGGAQHEGFADGAAGRVW